MLLTAFSTLRPVKASQQVDEAIGNALFDDVVMQRAKLIAYLCLYFLAERSRWVQAGIRRLGDGFAVYSLSAFHLSRSRRRAQRDGGALGMYRNVQNQIMFTFRRSP